MTEDVYTFKNLLSNYSQYKDNLIPKLKDEIDSLEYEETGVKGINYEKEPGGTFNEQVAANIRFKQMDDIEVKQIKLKLYESVVCYCDGVLKRLEQYDQMAYEFVVAKYIEGKTYKQIGNNNFYSESTIWDRIEKSLNKII